MSQGIYKITNLINDKTYIGQSVNIEKRWGQHIRYSKNKKTKEYSFPLYNSIRKHGTDNFKFEILELVPNKKDLTKKEKYYYNLYKPEYCLIEPNETFFSKKRMSVVQIDKETLKIIKRFDSISEASRFLKTNTKSISDVCKRKFTSAAGFYWSFEKDYNENWEPKDYKDRIQNKKVLQLEIKTFKILNEFQSISDASRFMNCSFSLISDTCNRINSKAYGYHWCFKDDYNKEWKPKESNYLKKVLQIDTKTGTILNTFNSLTEASKETNSHLSSICQACKNQIKEANGFTWRYANEIK